MNDSQQPSPASVDIPEFMPSDRGDAVFYARQVPSSDATATVRSVSYPRYVPILAVAGFAVSVSGFVLSLALPAIWPAAMLVLGLAGLWLSSLGARRAEGRAQRRSNIEIWSGLNWTATRSQGLPQQVGHMSPTA